MAHRTSPNPRRTSSLIAACVTALCGGLASAQPDLEPEPISFNGDPVVIANETGENRQPDFLIAGQPVYYSYAGTNSGNQTAGAFKMRLDVGDVFSHVLSTTSLSPNADRKLLDAFYPQLPAGQHLVTMGVDSLDEVSESDEDNNIYEFVLDVREPGPDLVPFDAGGGSPIIISTVQGTSVDMLAVPAGVPLYVDLGVSNIGSSSSGTIRTEFEIQETGYTQRFVSNSISPDGISQIFDIFIPPLSDGTYTLILHADVDDDAQESDETNNFFVRQLRVGAADVDIGPAGLLPPLFEPVMITTDPDAEFNATRISSVDPIFIDFAWGNNGTDTSLPFTNALQVLGVYAETFDSGPVPASAASAEFDVEIGPLAPGFYEVWVNYDINDDEQETDELNNQYITYFTVVPAEIDLALEPAHFGSSDLLVLSTAEGTSVDETEFDTRDMIYADWAWRNIGLDPSDWCSASIEVVGFDTYEIIAVPLESNLRQRTFDQPIGPLPAGTYTIRAKVDSLDEIGETNETNNVFERVITIDQASIDLRTTSASPSGERIVISTEPSTRDDALVITAQDTLYIDVAWWNPFSDFSGQFGYTIEIVGEATVSGTSPSIRGGMVVNRRDVEFGPLPAGTYTARFLLDPDNDVFETNETNNVHEKVFVVESMSAACNPADLNDASAPSPAFASFGEPDGLLTPTDFSAFSFFFSTGDLRADINSASAASPAFAGFGIPDGLLTPTDFSAFAAYFGAGCPCVLPGCP